MDKIAELQSKLNSEREKVTKLTQQLKGAGAEKLAELSTQLGAAQTQIATLTDDLVKAMREKEAEVTSLTGKIASLEKTTGTLLEERRVQHVEERVKQCAIPSLRPVLSRIYDALTLTTVVAKFTDEGKAVERNVDQLVDDLVASINKNAAPLFRSFAATEQPDREGAHEYADPAEEAEVRARKHMKDTGEKSYQKAVTAVLAADDDLRRAYNQRGRVAAR